MAIKCDIKKKLKIIKKENTRNNLFIGEVSWNNRDPRGVDIRKYDSGNDMLLKGVTVEYDDIPKVVKILSDHYVDGKEVDNTDLDDEIIEEVYEREIEKKEPKKKISDEEWNNMFAEVNEEQTIFKRNEYGMLMDKEGENFIIKRDKKKK